MVGGGWWPIRFYCQPSPLDLGSVTWGLGTGLDNSLTFSARNLQGKTEKSKFGFSTSESVRGHHDENFEWSQAEPLSKDESARAFLRFLDFSARNLQGKTENQILDF